MIDTDSLFAGTAGENESRAAARGRSSSGILEDVTYGVMGQIQLEAKVP